MIIRALRFVLFFFQPFSAPKPAKTKYTKKGGVSLRQTFAPKAKAIATYYQAMALRQRLYKSQEVAVNGSGCNPNSSGRAIFCKNLFTGESARWERYDIAGVIDPAKTPTWAKEKLAALQKPAEKPSILTGLDEGKKAIAERGAAPQPGKRDNHEL